MAYLKDLLVRRATEARLAGDTRRHAVGVIRVVGLAVAVVVHAVSALRHLSGVGLVEVIALQATGVCEVDETIFIIIEGVTALRRALGGHREAEGARASVGAAGVHKHEVAAHLNIVEGDGGAGHHR